MSVIAFPIDADFYYEFALSNPDGTAYAGKSDIQCHVSLADGGAAVTGMSAVDAAETSTAGTYAVTFDAVDSLAYITIAAVGRGGYIVTTQGSKVLASDPVRFTTAPRASS